MRRFASFLLLASFAFGFASCSGKAEGETGGTGPELVEIEKSFNVSNADFTRTSLDGDAVLWTDGDNVSVFDEYGNAFTGTVSGNVLTTPFNGNAKKVYAVYPASDQNSFSSGLLSAVIPSAQAAVVRGFGQDVNLSFACGSADEGELVFYNGGTVVNFTIPRDNVSYVKISSAKGEAIAGKVNAVFASAATPIAISADSALGEESVIVSGDFVKDSTYSAVLAPASLSGGLDVEVGNSDGTKTLASGKEALELIAGNIIKIGIDGSAVTPEDPSLPDPVDESETDLYQAYKDGKSIRICGRTYNKAIDGEADLVSATKRENLPWYFMKRKKVIFFEAEEGITFYSGNVVGDDGKNGISGDHVIISRYTDKRVTMKFDTIDGSAAGTKQTFRNGSYVFKNIDFDLSASSDYVMRGGEVLGDVSALHFDGCTFSGLSTSLFYTSGGTAQAIESLRFEKCTFLCDGISGERTFFNIYKSTVLDRFTEIVFCDNVVCSPGLCLNLATFFNVNGSVSAGTVGNVRIEVKNNIFYNVPGKKQMFRMYSRVGSIDFSGNVIYCDTDPGEPSYFFSLYDTSQTADQFSIGDNIIRASGSSAWYVVNPNVGAKLSPDGNGYTVIEESPFSEADAATGRFVLAEKYSSFGPRQ